MTYGEQAVGLTFNPSGNPDVDRVKQLYAELIDLCAGHRDSLDKGARGERARLFSIAITEAQTAQMWAVKALTWREDT
jgi:hypothetical protein